MRPLIYLFVFLVLAMCSYADSIPALPEDLSAYVIDPSLLNTPELLGLSIDPSMVSSFLNNSALLVVFDNETTNFHLNFSNGSSLTAGVEVHNLSISNFSATGFSEPTLLVTTTDEVLLRIYLSTNPEAEVQTAILNKEITVERVGCRFDSQCRDEEFCSSKSCTEVSGHCGYATRHTWVHFECCADSDCQAGNSCTASHECKRTLTEQEKLDALAAIAKLEQEIAAAKERGEDVSSLENLLQQLKTAYASNDPALGKLVDDAKKIPVQSSAILLPAAQGGSFGVDLFLVAFILVLVSVLAVGIAYGIWQRQKS